MLTENKAKSLEMYTEFYKDTLKIPTNIMNILNQEALKELVKTISEELGNTPLLKQLYLLFTQLPEQTKNTVINVKNTVASRELVERFGAVGVGIDIKTGEVEEETTKKIAETRQSLIKDISTAKESLKNTTFNLTTTLATIQQAITKLLINQQETMDIQEKEEGKANEVVVEHVRNNKDNNEVVVFEVMTETEKARRTRHYLAKKQFKRTKKTTQKLFNTAKAIFTYLENGTQEVQRVVA